MSTQGQQREPGRPELIVAATITPTGVLTVWGLSPSPQVVDEGAPHLARNALINLLRSHALATGQAVAAAASSPAGPWYFGVDSAGGTAPVDPELFAGVTLPDLDPDDVLAGRAAVFAAAADCPPAAMLALATDPDPAIRARALAELADWPDDPTPVADAELPADRLDRLARCDLAWVRVGVAANPGTSQSTLAALATSADPDVQATLATRYDLTADLLLLLATAGTPKVQAALSRNPSATFLTHPATPVPDPAGTPLPSTLADPDPGATAHPDPGPDLVGPAGVVCVAPAEQDTHPTPPPPIPTAAAADPAPTRLPRRVLGLLGAAAAVALLTLGGYTAVNTLGDDPAATASATVPWNGMSLPAGPDGPTDPAGDVAAGFAHTEAGAAMAAAHLSVRIDAYAGPASFDPTITTQTFGGDPGALLTATQARYDAAADRAGISDGGPIPTSTGQILGWTTDGWAPDYPTTVHLLVTSPDGTDTDYAIGVVWVDGDYQLIDPTRDDTFTTSPAADAGTYRRF